MAHVVLQEVSKVYSKQVRAVNQANIDIQDKEFIVLVGPSGCGKSTILRMIAGLEDVTEGNILIDGKVVNLIPPKNRDIAMVFQNYALYPHMTVFENMAFGLKLRRFSTKVIQKRVHEAADILGIRHLLDRKPKALSGGQRQRVAVGRAIVRKPKVFLFDEPLSNLDAKLRVQMRTEISKLHARLGTTMIYVTHDQVEAMTMGTRIVVLKDGEIQQFDSPLNLYSKPTNRFVAGFIGSPAMNFIDGRIIRNDELWFVKKSIKLKIPDDKANSLQHYVDRDICLGIRPEDLIDERKKTEQDNTSWTSSTVDVVEPMGNETILYLRFDDVTVVARVQPDVRPEVHSTLNIGFNMTKTHFFDMETENSITEIN